MHWKSAEDVAKRGGVERDRGSLRVSSIVYLALDDGQRTAQTGSVQRARRRVTPDYARSTSEMKVGGDNTYIRQTSNPSYAPFSHNNILPPPPSSPEQKTRHERHSQRRPPCSTGQRLTGRPKQHHLSPDPQRLQHRLDRTRNRHPRDADQVMPTRMSDPG